MLHTLAHRDIYSIYSGPQIWCGGDTSLLVKSRKALTVLNDSRIAYLIEPLLSDELDDETQEMLTNELAIYFLYVIHCESRGSVSI